MDTKTLYAPVESLIAKAVEARFSGDALKLSQAAVNVANAISLMEQVAADKRAGTNALKLMDRIMDRIREERNAVL